MHTCSSPSFPPSFFSLSNVSFSLLWFLRLSITLPIALFVAIALCQNCPLDLQSRGEWESLLSLTSFFYDDRFFMFGSVFWFDQKKFLTSLTHWDGQSHHWWCLGSKPRPGQRGYGAWRDSRPPVDLWSFFGWKRGGASPLKCPASGHLYICSQLVCYRSFTLLFPEFLSYFCSWQSFCWLTIDMQPYIHQTAQMERIGAVSMLTKER